MDKRVPAFTFQVPDHMHERLSEFNGVNLNMTIVKVVPDTDCKPFKINLSGIRRWFIVKNKQENFIKRLNHGNSYKNANKTQ